MRFVSRTGPLGCAIALGAVGLWAFRRHVTAHAESGSLEYVMWYFDNLGMYFPMLEYAASSLRAGHLPLWNPYQLAGIPFLATHPPEVFYPLNLPYLFLSTDRAMHLGAVGHVLLAGWMAALYARLALGVSRTASLAAGITFMVSSHVLWAFAAQNQLYSFPWIPLLFLGVDRAIRTPAPVWSLAIAGGISLPLLAGFPQMFSFEAYALLPYALACAAAAWRGPGALRQTRASLIWLAAGGLLGLLLAAPQVLPSLEMSLLSIRPPGGLSPSQIEPLFSPIVPGLRAFLDGHREPLSFIFPGVVIYLLLPSRPSSAPCSGSRTYRTTSPSSPGATCAGSNGCRGGHGRTIRACTWAARTSPRRSSTRSFSTTRRWAT